MITDDADPVVQHEVESDTAEGLRYEVVANIWDGRPTKGIIWQELLACSIKLLDSSLDGKLEEDILNWEPETSLIPENLTLLATPITSPAWPCVDSPRSPTVENDSVNRMKDSREIEMTRPENASPMIDPIVTHMNMPENLTPVSTPMTSLTWPCVDSPRSPMVEYDSVNRIKDSRGIEMTRPESTPPTIDSNVTLKNMPENFTLVSTPMTSLAWPCVDSP